MIKFVSLVKRHPSLSMEQFVNYYENQHVKLGEQRLKGNAVRYVRRYFYPIPLLSELAHDEHGGDLPLKLPPIPAGGISEADFDVMTEIWYENIDQWRSALAGYRQPANAQLIADDEARFIDRSRRRHYLVIERDTDLS